MSNKELPVIFLMGATATGKTGLAVDLHQALPVDVVSVDSAMVYRGMDVGTAKPSAELLTRVPHRLIDICDPVDSYSAARFRDDAMRAIQDITAAGRIPLLVGGTGLYFRALEDGISELPAADAGVRARLDREAREQGLEALHQRLEAVDPDSARRIHRNDPQRLQRALEVYELTGRSMTEHFRQNRGEALDRHVIKIILNPQDRETHRQVIGHRFQQMLEDGLVDEVRTLHDRSDLHAGLPAMRMVGYRQIWRYLEAQITYEDMVKHAIIATQQLAKRQLTWLRKERDYLEISAADVDKLSKVLNFIEEQAPGLEM